MTRAATFERPWSQPSIDEQRAVRRRMTLCAGASVNGVAGWYSAQRNRPDRKPPQMYRPRPVLPTDGASVADEMPDRTTLDELRDILP